MNPKPSTESRVDYALDLKGAKSETWRRMSWARANPDTVLDPGTNHLPIRTHLLRQTLPKRPSDPKALNLSLNSALMLPSPRSVNLI